MDIAKENISGFLDLNINSSVQSDTTLQRLLERAAMLGYDTVAVNVTANLDEMDTCTAKKKKKRKSDGTSTDAPVDFPDPDGISFTAPICPKSGQKLRILKRLTIEFCGQGDLSRVGQSRNYRKYDIVAAQPSTSAAFTAACQSLPVDLITIDHVTFAGYMMNRKLANVAARRGVSVELLYSPALTVGSARRQVIQRALEVSQSVNGKNVVMSSGARHEHQLRGPYDVPSVAMLFGLSEKAAKASVTSVPKNVVFHAVARNRTGWCVVQAIISPEGPAQQEKKKPKLQ